MVTVEEGSASGTMTASVEHTGGKETFLSSFDKSTWPRHLTWSSWVNRPQHVARTSGEAADSSGALHDVRVA